LRVDGGLVDGITLQFLQFDFETPEEEIQHLLRFVLHRYVQRFAILFGHLLKHIVNLLVASYFGPDGVLDVVESTSVVMMFGFALLVDEVVGGPGLQLGPVGGVQHVLQVELDVGDDGLDDVAVVELRARTETDLGLDHGLRLGQVERTAYLLHEQLVVGVEEVPAEGTVEKLQHGVVNLQTDCVLLQLANLHLPIEISVLHIHQDDNAVAPLLLVPGLQTSRVGPEHHHDRSLGQHNVTQLLSLQIPHFGLQTNLVPVKLVAVDLAVAHQQVDDVLAGVLLQRGLLLKVLPAQQRNLKVDLLVELMLEQTVLKFEDMLLVPLEVALHPAVVLGHEQRQRDVGLHTPGVEELLGDVHLDHLAEGGEGRDGSGVAEIDQVVVDLQTVVLGDGLAGLLQLEVDGDVVLEVGLVERPDAVVLLVGEDAVSMLGGEDALLADLLHYLDVEADVVHPAQLQKLLPLHLQLLQLAQVEEHQLQHQQQDQQQTVPRKHLAVVEQIVELLIVLVVLLHLPMMQVYPFGVLLEVDLFVGGVEVVGLPPHPTVVVDQKSVLGLGVEFLRDVVDGEEVL
jgi:hypothetical protein